MHSVDSSSFRHVSPRGTPVFQVPGKSQDRKFTAAMAIPTPKSTPASTRFEPPFTDGEGEPGHDNRNQGQPRAIVLVNAFCRRLTAFSQGDWPLTCANAADARIKDGENATEAGRSQREADFFRKAFFIADEFLSDDASRAPHRDSRATSRRTWSGGTVNVGSRKLKLRRAAAKLPHG